MAPDDRVVAAHEQAGAHLEREDEPWAIEIPDHPRRADSAEYVRSRKAMNAMAALDPAFFYGPPPWQDHHGGGP
jgi:hypothetical protein